MQQQHNTVCLCECTCGRITARKLKEGKRRFTRVGERASKNDIAQEENRHRSEIQLIGSHSNNSRGKCRDAFVMHTQH